MLAQRMSSQAFQVNKDAPPFGQSHFEPLRMCSIPGLNQPRNDSHRYDDQVYSSLSLQHNDSSTVLVVVNIIIILIIIIINIIINTIIIIILIIIISIINIIMCVLLFVSLASVYAWWRSHCEVTVKDG